MFRARLPRTNEEFWIFNHKIESIFLGVVFTMALLLFVYYIVRFWHRDWNCFQRVTERQSRDALEV
jgi:hypothetical protein